MTEKKKTTVTVKDGNTVIASSNYKVEYSNNVNAGKAEVKIIGLGIYIGSVTETFWLTVDIHM